MWILIDWTFSRLTAQHQEWSALRAAAAFIPGREVSISIDTVLLFGSHFSQVSTLRRTISHRSRTFAIYI
jgi:hypothetical protein